MTKMLNFIPKASLKNRIAQRATQYITILFASRTLAPRHLLAATLLSTFTLQFQQALADANIAERYFNIKESPLCGVAKCRYFVIYSVCEHPSCGTTESVEPCGEHWGAWRSVGSGHDDPCAPIGCKRVGGALGYDYRSVSFPPKPQEKTKYACQRMRTITNKCQNPSCGEAARKSTGETLAWNSCAHPLHNINVTTSNRLRSTTNDTPGLQQLLELVEAMTLQAGIAPLVQPGGSFDQALHLLVQYLAVASVFPSTTSEQSRTIKEAVVRLGDKITLEDLRSILGDSSFIELSRRLPSIEHACKAD